jgi:hypothetical protein
VSDNGSTPTPDNNPAAGVARAMLELVMDRFVKDEDEHFACVPMILSPKVVLVSFVLRSQVNHVTEEGITEIPPGSAISLVVQEWIVGDPSKDPEDDSDAVQAWQLKEIM